MMGYTALQEMQDYNAKRFGKVIGPAQPEIEENVINGSDMKAAALRFIHNSCRGLRFKSVGVTEEMESGNLSGTSIEACQIPYNMQMDIDRLCLARELEKFIDSGTAEDAYNVYYCFLEMFIGSYGKSKKMIELLSEFELNGSSLLMKHRDHYSHSVYVFTLGLAIYETNSIYRSEFKTFYGIKNENEAAHTFLEYWGLTSLFHDIGYPFELPFEQVASYFEVSNSNEKRKENPYIAYTNLGKLIDLDKSAVQHFSEIYGKEFHSTEELFADALTDRLGGKYEFNEEYILNKIHNKPLHPENYFYYMDHAYFSASRLYRELASTIGVQRMDKKHIDVLTAILLHNSIFKFLIVYYNDDEKRKAPLRIEDHPLAYLLMLCDELQCWDRTAYGRNSRTELHPMSAEFDFSDNAIYASYSYDSEETDKISAYEAEYSDWYNSGKEGKPPRLKDYSDMVAAEQKFTNDIHRIVDLTDFPLHVVVKVTNADRRNKHTYLSNSNFLHLYDFAVSLNGRYKYQDKVEDVTTEKLEKDFNGMSLEYRLSNINQAKSFSRYLNVINCLYTDRPVDFPMLKSFSKEQVTKIAPMEHERWLNERRAAGWIYGTEYGDSKQLREQLRCHALMIEGKITAERALQHFNELPPDEQDKDAKPFNTMLGLIKKFDGLRIYRYEI